MSSFALEILKEEKPGRVKGQGRGVGGNGGGGSRVEVWMKLYPEKKNKQKNPLYILKKLSVNFMEYVQKRTNNKGLKLSLKSHS